MGKKQDAVDRSMDWIDAEADKWALEVNLPSIVKNLAHVVRLDKSAPDDVREKFIARLEQNIDAVVRQTFLEAWYRSYDSYKAFLISQGVKLPHRPPPTGE